MSSAELALVAVGQRTRQSVLFSRSSIEQRFWAHRLPAVERETFSSFYLALSAVRARPEIIRVSSGALQHEIYAEED